MVKTSTLSQSRTGASERRVELADFLRSRRRSIRPEQVGLLPGSRRRTPGLRREEVAQLSGVSMTWYTWLEQGRPIQASDQVLDAIARALKLDRHERDYLFTLAGSSAIAALTERDELDPSLHLILERLGDYPAAVLGGRFDVLAHNHAYTALLGDLDTLPLDQRNIMWLLFTNPSFRDLVVDWEPTARLCVARYRARMAAHSGEPAWRSLIARLDATSEDFARIWRDHDIAGTETVIKRFAHRLGAFNYHSTALVLSDRTDTHLVTYTPADHRTARRTQALTDHTPTPLHATDPGRDGSELGRRNPVTCLT